MMLKHRLVIGLEKMIVKEKILPSQEETEEARKEVAGKINIKSMLISRSEIAKRFSVGKIRKGTKVNIKKDEYVFVGANPGRKFPEMLLFLDEKNGQYVRFTRSICE